jgi:hypothetical protein
MEISHQVVLLRGEDKLIARLSACCKVSPKFESRHCTPQHWALGNRAEDKHRQVHFI